MEFDAKTLNDKDIPSITFSDTVKLQYNLYQLYIKKYPEMKNLDALLTQLSIAIIDEMNEYIEHFDNHDILNAQFEAIDMYHFALEGMVAIAQTDDIQFKPKLVTADSKDLILKVGKVLKNVNWKHWKKKETKDYKLAYTAFSDILNISYTLFRVTAIGKPNSHFLKCYAMKNKENIRRQNEGY